MYFRISLQSDVATYDDIVLKRLQRTLGGHNNQNVKSIALELRRAPPGLDIAMEQGVQFAGSTLSCLPRWAGKPRQEQGGWGSTSLAGQEQFPDLFEIDFVLCQFMTCGNTGGHSENELKKENSAQVPNINVCRRESRRRSR